MRIPKLIRGLRSKGYEINLVGEQLHLKGTRYSITETQIDIFKRYKPQIVRFLRAEQAKL
jgi:GH35 family endo-1,4-beta-xylanase